MPFDPLKVGTQITNVGKKLESTGDKLSTTSQKLALVSNALANNGQLATSLVSIKNGASEVRGYLAPVSTGLAFIVTRLNAITVPTISFNTRTLDIATIKFTFVSGITVGSSKPFATMATKVQVFKDKVDGIRESLQNTVTGINSVVTSLPAMRTAITNGATDMNQTGVMLKEAGTTLIVAGDLLKV
jgi:hypothetical protein